MGNGSPRLLTQLLRRTGLLLLGSLAFAPNAFADDGLLSTAVDAVPVPISVSDTVPAAPAAPAAPSAPATPVATPVPATVHAVQATVDTRPAAAPIAASLPVQRPAPSRRATARKSFYPAQKPTARGAASPSPAGSSRTGVPVRGTFPMAAHAVSPARGPVPRPSAPPVPLPFSFDHTTSNDPAPVPPLLLLVALAAAFALLRVASLGRAVPLLLAAPRPHPYLLRLERPD
jgi:hypothetical protein